MAVRLLEIKRVLKDTGSLYLHCDHTAGAYLRQLLDAVFGKQNFRNEMVWYYENASRGKKQWARSHDSILYFSREKTGWHFNREAVLQPYKSGMTAWRYAQKGLEPPSGKTPDDVIILPSLNTMDQERTGYPTQKPVALAERIIKASCPEDGVVLDCFAGCAYVAIAAERLNRNWVACDINARAWTVFKRQFSKPSLATLTCAEPMHNLQPALIANSVTVHGPEELPIRTTNGAHQSPPTLKLRDKPRKFKTPASIIPESEMLEILLKLSGYQAWRYGFANRLPDGTIIETARNFHLDHLNPVSKDVASHQIVNRAPLCPYHNIKKSNHRLHLAEYREAILKAGEMMVADPAELIDLTEAAQSTMDIYADRRQQKQPDPTDDTSP